MRAFCDIHGDTMLCFCSGDTVELHPDGTLCDVVVVSLKNKETGDTLIQYLLSPAEAAKYPVIDNTLPFETQYTRIANTLVQMCSKCFIERRAVLEAQQQRTT